MPESIAPPAAWVLFTLGVVGLLALDLTVFHRRSHVVGFREAFAWSLFWVTLALLLGGWIAARFGAERGLEFLTGYLIEETLSVDNLFVFYAVFSYFAVPAAYQHRVLFWGILGAIVLRGVFIVTGSVLLSRFHWLFVVFGAFLVLTGLKILTQRERDLHPERNPAVRLMRRLVPMTPTYHGARFVVREGGRRLLTPLALVLVVVETTDVIFAVDSIPAIFAVTRDPFLVFTSNICAILGLRTLYFLLAQVVERLRYLKAGLGCVLIFVGVKMLISEHVPIAIGHSLAIVMGLLCLALIASLLHPAPKSQ